METEGELTIDFEEQFGRILHEARIEGDPIYMRVVTGEVIRAMGVTVEPGGQVLHLDNPKILHQNLRLDLNGGLDVAVKHVVWVGSEKKNSKEPHQ